MPDQPAWSEMPKYRCHKVVRAMQIAEVLRRQNVHSCVVIPSDETLAPISISGDWVHRHKPEPGGYYVVYEDGYASYSPATAFEEGYDLID